MVASLGAFRPFRLDLDALRGFDRPVYQAVGGSSDPDYFARQVDRFSTVFADLTVEVYDERHHVNPPHQAEPGGLAAALTRMWARPRSDRHRLRREPN